MARHVRSFSMAFLAAFLAILTSGCGGKDYEGPQRAEVKGKVSFNGEPIKNGTINLKPLDTEGGRSAGGTITDGQYLIPEENGPTFGKYRVEIFAFEPIGGASGNGDAEEADKTKQILPAKFNNDSTIELEVDKEVVEEDFDLKP